MWGKKDLSLQEITPHLYSTVSHGSANPYYSLSWEWTVEKPHGHSNLPCMSISVRWEMCLYGSHTSLHKINSGVSRNDRVQSMGMLLKRILKS